MVETILVITQSRLSDTKPIVEALSSVFGDSEIVLYVTGRMRRDFEHQIRDIDVEEILYDYYISKERPAIPDHGYLKDFEESLGGPGTLNRCIVADRKLSKDGQIGLFNDQTAYNYQSILSHVECRAKSLESIFDRYDFDLIFGRRTEVIAGMIAYELSLKNDVPFFRRQHSRVADKYLLHEGPYEHSDHLWEEVDRAESLRSEYPTWEDATQLYDDVRDGGPIYWRSDPSYGQYRSSLPEQVKYIANLLISERGGITTEYYYDTPKIKYIYKKVRKLLNKRYLDWFGGFDNFDPNEEYIFFPMQAQPEVSLMVWTTYFTDFPPLMDYISRSTSIQDRVYVNDHPRQWGVRSRRYYKRLNRNWNTSMLPVSIDTREIIEHSNCVITVTSSVGFEALIYDTPVVTFGRSGCAPFYANFDSVDTVDSIYDLPATIQRSKNSIVDDAEIKAYIAACLNVGVSMDHPSFYESLLESIPGDLLT